MSEQDSTGASAAWEAAYRRFETVDQERRKFRRRLVGFGAERWPRELEIAELFCGRGSALSAWSGLGFNNLTGIDLSPALLAGADPRFKTIVADARNVPLPSGSIDVISIQGGLHHLPRLPEDLQSVLDECRRVLRPNGRLLLVEPWLTPFLRLVHAGGRSRWLRRSSPRLDALSEMIELEAATYFAWLSAGKLVLATLKSAFPPEQVRIHWGKLHYLARRPWTELA